LPPREVNYLLLKYCVVVVVIASINTNPESLLHCKLPTTLLISCANFIARALRFSEREVVLVEELFEFSYKKWKRVRKMRASVSFLNQVYVRVACKLVRTVCASFAARRNPVLLMSLVTSYCLVLRKWEERRWASVFRRGSSLLCCYGRLVCRRNILLLQLGDHELASGDWRECEVLFPL
jgi:hypothetical protein